MATAQVAMISLDGIIKIASIIFSVILVAVVFPGLPILALEIWAYFELRKYIVKRGTKNGKRFHRDGTWYKKYGNGMDSAIASVIMLFVSGGDISEQIMENVFLLSVEGFFKINATLFVLILVATVFIPGPIFVIGAIMDYIEHKQSLNWLDKIIITYKYRRIVEE